MNLFEKALAVALVPAWCCCVAGWGYWATVHMGMLMLRGDRA